MNADNTTVVVGVVGIGGPARRTDVATGNVGATGSVGEDGTLLEPVGNRDLSEATSAGSYIATPPFDPPITVSPMSALLNSGMSQTFSGSATGANPAVTWTLLPGGPTWSGATFVYTAPHVTGTNTQTLRVTSVANGAFRDVGITVQPIGINWSSVATSAATGQTVSFGATLSNLVAGASNQVTWSATGGTFVPSS